MRTIITGRLTSTHLLVLAALTGVFLGAAGCNKVPLLAPGLSTISLAASNTVVQANGTVQISATVIESSGTPVQNGTHVTFSTDLGSVAPLDATTVNGVASAEFVANGQSGVANVRATSGAAKDASAAAAATALGATLKLTVGGAAAGRIGVTANPTTVSSNGGNSAITANVVDPNGNALSSVTVTFSTTAGALSNAVATTDASGNAQTTLTTNKQATVTATAGAASGTTAVPTGTVIVNVNTVPTVAAFSPSPSAPTIGQAVAFNITATPGGSPVVRIVVDFGDGASQTINGSSGGAFHTYTQTGTYVVRATAFDTFGDTGGTTTSVTVTAAARPTVTISPSANPTAGNVTTFTVGATPGTGGAQITNLTVTFGDNTSANLGASGGTGQTVQHVYATGGTYTATATATDANGLPSQASTVIFVNQALSVSAPAHSVRAGAWATARDASPRRISSSGPRASGVARNASG